MTYKATGNPPGRPRTKQPAAPKPKQPKPETHPATELPVPPPPGREGTELAALGELCKECFPAGWPAGATGLGCKHGSWTRRIS